MCSGLFSPMKSVVWEAGEYVVYDVAHVLIEYGYMNN